MGRVSFEGTYAERTIAERRRRRNPGVEGYRRCRRLIVADGFQKCRGRSEEKIAGYGAAEIQQPIVVARRPADEHVHQHQLDRPRRTRVADEVSAELTAGGAA